MKKNIKSILPWLVLLAIGAIIQLIITINQPNSELSFMGGIIVMAGGILIAIRIAQISKKKQN